MFGGEFRLVFKVLYDSRHSGDHHFSLLDDWSSQGSSGRRSNLNQGQLQAVGSDLEAYKVGDCISSLFVELAEPQMTLSCIAGHIKTMCCGNSLAQLKVLSNIG